MKVSDRAEQDNKAVKVRKQEERTKRSLLAVSGKTNLLTPPANPSPYGPVWSRTPPCHGGDRGFKSRWGDDHNTLRRFDCGKPRVPGRKPR